MICTSRHNNWSASDRGGHDALRTGRSVTEMLVGANSKLDNISENVDKSSLKSRVIVKLLVYVKSRQVV